MNFAMQVRLFLLATLSVEVRSKAFLAHLRLNMTRNISDTEFKRALFAELEEVLGGDLSSETEQRVVAIEDALRPMYTAMPKNADEKLGPAGVKYALRRLFIQRQGWVVEGLEPTIDDWHPAKGSFIMEDKAPEIVHEVITKHLAEDGAGLHELAVIAAMMEQLIFEDTVGKLLQAYRARELNPESKVSKAQAQDLVQLFLAGFIRNRDVSLFSPKQVSNFLRLIYTLYPHWPQVVPLMIQVQERVAPGLEVFSFDDVASVVSEVSSSFAHWQNAMCQTTTEHLVELEEGSSGRVRLVDFYNAALHKGRYQFTETITYLRQLGTLDESDELNPRVIIPNYVSGRSNCVARNSYYSVCCIDKCEDVFGQLERKLGTAFVSPSEILSALAEHTALRSSDDENLIDVSNVLRRRLDEVSAHHGGLIPLHGRLFAQWMHLAFPHDCPYPHKSGTVYYNSIERWEAETGERSGSSIEEIETWSDQLGKLAQKRDEIEGDRREKDYVSGMWTMEEELVFGVDDAQPDAASLKLQRLDGRWYQIMPGGQSAAMLASIFWMVWLALRRFGSSTRKSSSFDKLSVEKWSV